MSEMTPNLDLPLMMPTQAQKHVTHNEAIELLDALAQLVLEDADLNTPPTAPAEGQAWGVGANPTGDWAGQAGAIASFHGGGWMFITPRDGWTAWVVQDAAFCVNVSGTWTPLASLS